MGTYNIFGYNAASDDEPGLTVVLNDDNTEIVSVTGPNPDAAKEDETTLRGYVTHGVPPLAALKLLAGSYGQVWAEGADRSNPQTGWDTEDTEEGTVVSAAEGEAEPFTLPDGIMAMTEDNGTVVTLTKRDPEHGTVYRRKGEWKPLLDPTVLDGLTFVGVTATAEVTYDKYETEDKLVGVGHYVPSAEGPFWPGIVVEYPEPENEGLITVDDDEDGVKEGGQVEEAVTAAVVLNSASDLDYAISAALLNKDLRWYVERRIAALGLEVDVPWSEG